MPKPKKPVKRYIRTAKVTRGVDNTYSNPRLTDKKTITAELQRRRKVRGQRKQAQRPGILVEREQYNSIRGQDETIREVIAKRRLSPTDKRLGDRIFKRKDGPNTIYTRNTRGITVQKRKPTIKKKK